MTVCSCHVTYEFQSETTLYSCLNVKEALARSRREIWSLSDCNWTRTQNHLVRNWTLTHLAKLASLSKWLSVRLQTKWSLIQIQIYKIKQLTWCYLCWHIYELQGGRNWKNRGFRIWKNIRKFRQNLQATFQTPAVTTTEKKKHFDYKAFWQISEGN